MQGLRRWLQCWRCQCTCGEQHLLMCSIGNLQHGFSMTLLCKSHPRFSGGRPQCHLQHFMLALNCAEYLPLVQVTCMFIIPGCRYLLAPPLHTLPWHAGAADELQSRQSCQYIRGRCEAKLPSRNNAGLQVTPGCVQRSVVAWRQSPVYTTHQGRMPTCHVGQ